MNACQTSTSRSFRPCRDARRLGAALGVVLALISGCRSNYLNENDELRRANMELTEKVETLTKRSEGLEKALSAAERRARMDKPELPEGLSEPVCVAMLLGLYSGAIDEDRDGANDALRLYLATLDQQGRFVQTIGKLHVTVAAIPAGAEAVTLAARTLEPKEFDEAYRQGLTGTHYTIVVPVKQIPEGVDSLTVTFRLDDLLTGESIRREEVIKWKNK